MRQSIYPDWFDVACAECGEVLNVFCFTKKDRVAHLHFCEDKECLKDYYNARFEGKKANCTIGRLTAMRDNRNKRVKEYLNKVDRSKEDDEDLLYTKPNEETMRRIRQRDEEYKIKLRQHRGLEV